MAMRAFVPVLVVALVGKASAVFNPEVNTDESKPFPGTNPRDNPTELPLLPPPKPSTVSTTGSEGHKWPSWFFSSSNAEVADNPTAPERPNQQGQTDEDNTNSRRQNQWGQMGEQITNSNQWGQSGQDKTNPNQWGQTGQDNTNSRRQNQWGQTDEENRHSRYKRESSHDDVADDASRLGFFSKMMNWGCGCMGGWMNWGGPGRQADRQDDREGTRKTWWGSIFGDSKKTEDSSAGDEGENTRPVWFHRRMTEDERRGVWSHGGMMGGRW